MFNYKIISKEDFTEKIEKELTAEPINNYIETKKDLSFPIYKSLNENEMLIPKFYSCDNSFLKKNKINSENISSMKFKGALRNYQESTVKECFSTIKEKGGIILSLKTGQGKTVCAINLISKIKKKCLIIVHKTFLMTQWIERILEFTDLDLLDIGIIQGKKLDTKNKPVVIGMLQSLSLKDYPQEIFDDFDFVIVDECHHISSKSFSKALLKLRSTFTLGLSATPERTDGLTYIFKYFLGEDIFKLEENKIKHVQIQPYFYKNSSEEEKHLFQIKKIYNGNLNLSAMITNLTLSQERNNFILNKIPVNENRNVLVLSSRIEQLEFLCKEFKSRFRHIKSDLYIGKMKSNALKQAEKAQIIFATYQMVSEAFDLPKLNTLVFASPQSNVEQSCGRILRKISENIKPLIIDICDLDIPVFIGQYKKRKKFYLESEWIILHS